jgi:hypothetical protein
MMDVEKMGEEGNIPPTLIVGEFDVAERWEKIL